MLSRRVIWDPFLAFRRLRTPIGSRGFWVPMAAACFPLNIGSNAQSARDGLVRDILMVYARNKPLIYYRFPAPVGARPAFFIRDPELVRLPRQFFFQILAQRSEFGYPVTRAVSGRWRQGGRQMPGCKSGFMQFPMFRPCWE